MTFDVYLSITVCLILSGDQVTLLRRYNEKSRCQACRNWRALRRRSAVVALSFTSAVSSEV